MVAREGMDELMLETVQRGFIVRTAVLVTLLLLVGACADGGSGSAGGTEAAAGGTSAGSERSTGEAEADPTGTATGEGAGATEVSCYEGETATFVVSYGTGGGYDQIARFMAPYLEEELGATVVVENQGGAGGLLAMNSLATSAPDGLRFGFFTGQGVVGSVLGGAEGVNFELLDMSFVGRTAADPRVLVVGGSSELHTMEDVMAAEGLKFGSAGPGANDYIDATVLYPILGLDGEIVSGFENSDEIALALTAGDVELFSGTIGSRLSAIESGDHRPVLAIGSERLDGFPDVPALTELDLGEEQLAIAQAHSDLQEMGRVIFAPPGVPSSCLDELIAAVGDVMGNPDFAALMEDSDQEIDWVPGPEMRELAEGLLNAPDEFVALLEAGYTSQ